MEKGNKALYTGKPTSTHIHNDSGDADTIKCIAYYRVSTDRQGKSGLGLEAQQEAVADFVQSRVWQLVGEFTEVESGKRKDRPRLQEAINKTKRIKGKLIIAKLDRLARNVHFISGLMETGVDFLAVDMPTADRFMLHVYAAMAEEEGRRVSQRTKAALAAAKARGVKLGVNGKALAKANKDAAIAYAETLSPIIDDIQKDCHKTLREITAALNERDIPSREGEKWHLRSTALLLRRLAGL